MDVNDKTFIDRLESGKSWNWEYELDGHEGLVQVWKYGEKFILTWEECVAGRQFDESEYTRDDRIECDTASDILVFLKEHSINLSVFKP